MYEHPAIRECCVISSPDSYRGETVKALVAVHEVARLTVSPEDILSWSRGRMASYKAPCSIVFVDRLPRNESNKISWRLLQDAEWKR